MAPQVPDVIFFKPHLHCEEPEGLKWELLPLLDQISITGAVPGSRSLYDAVELLEPVYPGVFIFKVHCGDFTVWPLR